MARLRARLAQAGSVAGLLGLAAAAFFAGAPERAQAQCSVFDRHPCAPTTCSVFRRRPCTPEFDDPIGQDLRLTIESAPAENTTSAAATAGYPSDAERRNAEPAPAEQAEDGTRKLSSIRELFAALRACWVPPAESEAQPGMQMSVRFAFKRTGEIIGTPRITYVTPDTPNEVRERYHDAITAALTRCTPMQFTSGMDGAVAGRPIAIRFVDNRTKP